MGEMGVEKYHILFIMFLALQHQFTRFIEHRPELMEEGLEHLARVYDDHTGLTCELVLDLDYLNLDMNMYHDLQEGQTNQQAVDLDLDWLNQLTELEEQTLVLEERLRRAMIKIFRSQRCMSQSWKDVGNIQGRLKKLQAELRAAIETLEVKGKSTGRYRRRIFSNRWSMLEQKKQVRERCPLRFRSCPNIPSILEDLEFDHLRKSESLNRTIVFKDSLEDTLKVMRKDLDCLKKLCENMMKLNFKQAAGQSNKSDSSGVRDTACNATGHSSGQSGQHHVNAMHMGHSEQHRKRLMVHDHPINSTHRTRIQRRPSQDTEDDSLREHHHSYRNSSEVSPSQNVGEISHSGASAQPDNESRSPEVKKRRLMVHDHPINSTHRTRIRRRPSQNVSEISHSGASAQPDNESRSPEVKKVNHEKVPTTGKKTKSSGSPSFSLTNISVAIYKTMAASCAAILIFI